MLRHAPWLVVLLIGGIAIAQSADEGRDFPHVGNLEEDVFHRGDRQTDIIQTTHAAAWRNNSSNITSLRFHANSATLSNTLVVIYRMR